MKLMITTSWTATSWAAGNAAHLAGADVQQSDVDVCDVGEMLARAPAAAMARVVWIGWR
ncbi:hypothetical protein N9L68_06455 [bacterium]|nr:hypothetical protein [bacterium]